ncbi:MAG: tetratricopeptide repeat protein [Bacteroidota bacterium]|nr:tetratricopeptide repeat protein [Bacteroidota bacterium]MDP4286590.1 tetratricopeptide repeat protein [Bacteroidota bacterium]
MERPAILNPIDEQPVTKDKLQAWFTAADALRQQGRLLEAASEFDGLIANARATGEREIEGRATNTRGVIEERREDYPSAKTYHDRALAIALEIGDRIGAGLARTDLAWVYQQWEMHDLAMDHARAALDELLGTPEEHVALHRMGTLLADSCRYRAALEFFEKALASVRSGSIATPQLERALSLNYAWSASMHLHLGDAMLAKEINLKALELVEQLDDPINVANLTAKIGYCEMELGEIPAARERMHLASNLYLAQGRLSSLASCQMSIADLETRSGNPAEALSMLESASKYLQESGSKRFAWRLHETYSSAYEAMGDWRMVVHHDRERERSREERDSEQLQDKLGAAQILIATQRERHAMELQKLRAEKLEQQIAMQLLSVAAQAELVQKIRDGIREAVRRLADPINTLNEIQEIIRALPRQEIDWPKFEAQLTMLHPGFRTNLEIKFPELTSQEVRVCALVRVGLINPEIAKLLSLSERTLENHRFNIRKKLGLKTGDHLGEFLSGNV